VGTIAYMSPEQLRGQPLDARSDLFSLGLVMYEMITGRRAFGGETSAVIAAAILWERPVLPREHRGDVPPRLEDIILKTIEKDPADRTQTATELRADLRRFKREVELPAAGAASKEGVGTRRRVVAVAAGVLVIALAAVGYLQWRGGFTRGVRSNALLEGLQLSQVTSTGTAWRPTLSPDGKYVVYVKRDNFNRSLRVRQLGTDRDVELVASDGVNLQAATVTPDGGFVDFLRGKGGAPTLWRVPFLGGAPKRLIDNVNSPIGWSPDGKHFAFVRAGFEGASALVVADADGSNERTVAARALPGQFLSFGMRGTPSAQGAVVRPAWSPDGRTLALLGFGPVSGVHTRHAIFVDAATGAERTIPLLEGGSADGIEWLDANHLVLSMRAGNEVVCQFWVLSYPDGTWKRLTNDLSNYASFGLSGDRQSIAAARWDYQVGISILDDSAKEPSPAVAPTPFVGLDIGWAKDRLLYAVLSPADNRPTVWAIGRGQSNPEELIANASSAEATADGQRIVFSRVENNRQGIWRADQTGRNAAEIGPVASGRISLTPDGKRVVFVTNQGGTQSTWMMPVEGGKPLQVANVFSYYPAISRDGASLAFVSVNETKTQAVISICALSDCTERRTFPAVRSPTALQWTPDGRGVAYSMLSNVWVQPRDGGTPYQLTKFPEDDWRIEDFEWSLDGKRLAFSRSKTSWDIVLLRGAAR